MLTAYSIIGENKVFDPLFGWQPFCEIPMFYSVIGILDRKVDWNLFS